MPDEIQGPYVQVAAFCQTAMIENTGAVSVIRITDRVGVAGITAEMGPTPIQITLIIILKSGFMRTQSKISVRPIPPNQGQMPPLEFPALFEGDDRGVQLVMPMGFVAQEQGLYWFEIAVEGLMLTRIPLRVMYQQIMAPPGGFAFPGTPPGIPPAR